MLPGCAERSRCLGSKSRHGEVIEQHVGSQQPINLRAGHRPRQQLLPALRLLSCVVLYRIVPRPHRSWHRSIEKVHRELPFFKYSNSRIAVQNALHNEPIDGKYGLNQNQMPVLSRFHHPLNQTGELM